MSALGLDEYRVHVKAVIKEAEKMSETDRARLLSRDGYGIDMTFTLYDADDALTVPSGAVFTSEGSDYVYVVENGRAVRRKIKAAYRSASLVVLDESSGEVREGDTVIDQADTKGIYEGVKVR